MRSLLLLLANAMVCIGAAPPAAPQPLTIKIEGLRSMRGNILICVTRSPHHFPDCSADKDSRHLVMPAGQADMALGMMMPGDYAIAIIHDENGNGRLDTFAGIPREGVGFSRNPVVRFGAPGFHAAQFAIGAAPARQGIKIKYFL